MHKLPIQNVYDLIPPKSGELNQYFGRIGSGKTYCATTDVLNDLNNGQVVYCNWKINWQGYDQRKILFYKLLGIIGLKKTFKYYPKENLRYLPIDDNIQDTLGRLTDCIIYLDEGHMVFDSYMATKMPIKNRANILHTRHFDRRINIISQRFTAIHAVLRDNVNRFFKLECIFKFGWLILFRKQEFQDLDALGNLLMDEPISKEYYFGRPSIFKIYDTKYMRGNLSHSQPNLSEFWRINWKDWFNKSMWI